MAERRGACSIPGRPAHRGAAGDATPRSRPRRRRVVRPGGRCERRTPARSRQPSCEPQRRDRREQPQSAGRLDEPGGDLGPLDAVADRAAEVRVDASQLLRARGLVAATARLLRDVRSVSRSTGTGLDRAACPRRCRRRSWRPARRRRARPRSPPRPGCPVSSGRRSAAPRGPGSLPPLRLGAGAAGQLLAAERRWRRPMASPIAVAPPDRQISDRLLDQGVVGRRRNGHRGRRRERHQSDPVAGPAAAATNRRGLLARDREPVRG